MGLEERDGDVEAVDGRAARSQAVSEAAARVYGAWRALHPTADATPAPDRAALLRRSVEATARGVAGARAVLTPGHVAEAAGRLEVLVAWHHAAPAAAWYQAEPVRLGLDYVLRAKALSDRIDAALAWSAAGRPRGERRVDPQIGAEAAKAWSHVATKLLVEHGARFLQRWKHPEAAKHAAVEAAVAAIGGPSAMSRATAWDLEKDIGPRFVAAYIAHRTGGTER